MFAQNKPNKNENTMLIRPKSHYSNFLWGNLYA